VGEVRDLVKADLALAKEKGEDFAKAQIKALKKYGKVLLGPVPKQQPGAEQK
jgi:hypothetical protein